MSRSRQPQSIRRALLAVAAAAALAGGGAARAPTKTRDNGQ